MGTCFYTWGHVFIRGDRFSTYGDKVYIGVDMIYIGVDTSYICGKPT